jgi:hypothetical protein
MGNKNSLCCRSKHNIDNDFEYLDNNNTITPKIDLKALILIQSYIRKFLIKTKIKKLLLFSPDLIPGLLVEKDYKPKFEIKDQKFLEIINSLKKLEINEKDLEFDTNKLKEFSILYPDKSFYIGYYNRNWKKEGKGILYLSDGSKYEGCFKDDEMHGRGRLVNIEGFYYEGEFKNNQANGYGKYYNLDGTNFIGFWKNDLQNGTGEEVFLDGSKYEGNYQNGKKNGLGKFIWPGSSYYKGNFKDNEIHGEGVYYWKDGRMFSGNWIKNKMEGLGIFFWPDGKTYKGSYLNDKKHGYGIFTWPDGRSYEGEWKLGKQSGYGIFKSKEDFRYGEWNNGEKISWIDKFSKDYEIVESHLIKKKVQYDFKKIEVKFEKEKQKYISCKNILNIFK